MPAGFEHLPVGSEVATTVAERDGAFTFLNVPSGSYTLIGQDTILELVRSPSANDMVPDPPGFPAVVNGGGGSGTPSVRYVFRRGASTLSFVRRSLAIGQDVSSLVIPLSPTVSVRGRVIYADGAAPPLPNTHLPISLDAMDGDPTLGNPSEYVDANGAFAINGVLPGRYRLWASGRVISSIIWRGRDVTESGIELAPGESADDIAITVTGKPARVDATVTGLTKDVRAAVIIFPAAREQWSTYGRNTLRIASGSTSAEGLVSFVRLPAGEYYVIAVTPSKANSWVDPAFLSAASTAATRTSVGWGETTAVSLKVQAVVVR
jgi:hypothetical protein